MNSKIRCACGKDIVFYGYEFPFFIQWECRGTIYGYGHMIPKNNRLPVDSKKDENNHSIIIYGYHERKEEPKLRLQYIREDAF